MALVDWVGPLLNLAGGFIASRGGEKAADATEAAGEAALQFQREALQAGINLARPSLEVGVSGANSALGQLSSIFGLNTPSEINFDNITGGGGSAPGFAQGFDPNTPMTATQITQAYRNVYGRDPDPGGLQFHLTRGPRGESSGISRGSAAAAGAGIGAQVAGPLGAVAGGIGGALLGGKDEGDRRAFTFNEFLQVAQGSAEYQDKKERGLLPPTQEGGQFSANFTGAEIQDPQARQTFLSELQQQQGGGQQGSGRQFQPTAGGGVREVFSAGQPQRGGPDLNQLVAQNPLIQFTRQQGEESLARRQSALGLSESTPGIEGFIDFNNRLANAGVQDLVVNPLMQLAGFGQQGSNQLSGVTQGFGNNAANIALNTGNARASSFQNTGNIASNTLGGIGNDIFLRNLLRNQGGTT